MSNLPSDPFIKPASTRLHSLIPESVNGTSINAAHPSSAPTLITPSSTIRVADIAMPVTSEMPIFLPQSEHQSLIESNWQVARLKSLRKEWWSTCNKFYLSPLVCINPKPLSSIIGNTDIDFLSSHCPTSPPNTPVLNVCWGTEVTVACEIPLNLLAINWYRSSSFLIPHLIRVKTLYKELLIPCNILLLSWLVHACSKSLYSVSDNSV